jgi:hypothetical protein
VWSRSQCLYFLHPVGDLKISISVQCMQIADSCIGIDIRVVNSELRSQELSFTVRVSKGCLIVLIVRLLDGIRSRQCAEVNIHMPC